MSEMRHHAHGVLGIEAEFEKINVLFAGATHPGEHSQMNVSLSIRNNSAATIPFTFNTTQRFEIELVDASGTVRARWSDGREFGQIVTTQELAPHSSWRFDGELIVPDGPAGDFTVRVYVTADKRPGAQSPLHITLAP
jgi:Intracellular proteinase inhibitor